MQSVGQRKIEMSQSIVPGEYTVKMIANEVPDGRGTYYICFSNNVEVLSGSQPLTAKNVITKQDDTASWRIKVNQAIGPISFPMSAGQHNIKLLGIKADDGIGTYYIEFEGSVISVAGDAQEGRDLLKDSAKEFNIEVGEIVTGKSSKGYLLKLQVE